MLLRVSILDELTHCKASKALPVLQHVRSVTSWRAVTGIQGLQNVLQMCICDSKHHNTVVLRL